MPSCVRKLHIHFPGPRGESGDRSEAYAAAFDGHMHAFLIALMSYRISLDLRINSGMLMLWKISYVIVHVAY